MPPRADFYATGRPGPEDVLLLVEVMDTTAQTDRGVKLPLYAPAGVGEVWLADLDADSIEVYRRPTASGYGDARVLLRGERIAPQAFPDLSLTIDELLGGRRRPVRRGRSRPRSDRP